MESSELAERYFASVRARDIEAFMALFDDEAIIVQPDGATFSGKQAIREMELRVFGSVAPTPNIVGLIASTAAVVAEIQVSLPDGSTRRMASIFRLNATGQIQSLRIYRQGR